jgi:hypothetical protein
MSKSNGPGPEPGRDRTAGITRLGVRGYKSIARRQEVDIRPLTVLAGANSSGKSSMMQPFLLLKQTLEAAYDPGPLLLDGPNLVFRSADDFLARNHRQSNELDVSFALGDALSVELLFKRGSSDGLRLQQVVYHDRHGPLVLTSAVPMGAIVSSLPVQWQGLPDVYESVGASIEWKVARNRCFFELSFVALKMGETLEVPVVEAGAFAEALTRLIHLPALRGNPARAYPVAAVGDTFPGTFEPYTASLIANWQATDPGEGLSQLETDLKRLGLASKLAAVRLNDAQVELKVGRLLEPAPSRGPDLVNLADVGFGVSQALPLLVALHVAEPGQLVYVEEPESHLHPRAQFALAQVLAGAAKRGVRVVVETHSSILLLGIQTLVAEGGLEPDKVKLHWFRREKDGRTLVRSADLDEAGAFGDWPEDFDDVQLQSQAQYLDAAGARRLSESKRP